MYKSTNRLIDRPRDLTSDSEDCESTTHISRYKDVFKKRRVLNTSSESEDAIEQAAPSQTRNENEILWEMKDLKPINHEFNNSNSGIKANINDTSSILDIFKLFFSEETVGFIAEESNKYYAYTEKANSPSGVNNYNETTVPEIYTFLAVTMLMTRIRKLSLNEYWSADKLIRTESFREIISRDRYLLLLKILHFHDKSIIDDDPLVKIRYILNRLKTSFKTTFYPYETLCIDESLLLFNERCFFKQFIPSKRSRFGIKSFVLCDSKTGYIQDLMVYSAAQMQLPENRWSKSIGKPEMIVMTLLESYLGKGHTLVTDDCYSSPSLFLELHKNLTNAYGTVRKTRLGIPYLNQNLQKGEYAFCSTNNLLALKWMDKREVWMISTSHSADIVKTKRIHCQTKENIMKPQCVIDYNNTMGTVHRVDMLLNSLHSIRKNLKWYKKYFFHLLDLAIFNTYVLYKHVTGKNVSFSTFHLRLIKQIFKKHGSINRYCSKGKNCENEPFRLTQRHFPSANVKTTAIRKNARRKCVVCTKNNRRRETHYECKKCNVGLCIEPCFEVYHTVQDY